MARPITVEFHSLEPALLPQDVIRGINAAVALNTLAVLSASVVSAVVKAHAILAGQAVVRK
jgi:hypothetical protein